jgi:hypothetical protein
VARRRDPAEWEEEDRDAGVGLEQCAGIALEDERLARAREGGPDQERQCEARGTSRCAPVVQPERQPERRADGEQLEVGRRHAGSSPRAQAVWRTWAADQKR